MTEITDQPIDVNLLLERVKSNRAGAVVFFLGTTREFTGNRRTLSLDYDSYQEMALSKLKELNFEARRRWDLVECAIIHRRGNVALGEASVAVAVSAPHRKEAFEAVQWLMDTLKATVPIWKKENWADGTSEWVHPDTGRDDDESSEKALP